MGPQSSTCLLPSQAATCSFSKVVDRLNGHPCGRQAALDKEHDGKFQCALDKCSRVGQEPARWPAEQAGPFSPLGIESFSVSAELRIGRGVWATKAMGPKALSETPPSAQGKCPVLRLFPNPDAQTLAQVLRARFLLSASGFLACSFQFQRSDFDLPACRRSLCLIDQ